MANLTLGKLENGNQIDANVGDTLAIQLSEAPTTGYRWAIGDSGAPVLELESDDFAPAGKGIGGKGQRTFRFEVKKQGTGKITLRHARIWEGKKTDIDYTVTVRVG